MGSEFNWKQFLEEWWGPLCQYGWPPGPPVQDPGLYPLPASAFASIFSRWALDLVVNRWLITWMNIVGPAIRFRDQIGPSTP
uniref:Uncharacterized protein n=1 Tax=Oryza punctata TaxID=4537 RepID=A0A0E0LWR8_ORYPU